jgi:hypothetical protein
VRGTWLFVRLPGLAILAGALAYAWFAGVRLPQRFDPWAPLDVAREPDWLTQLRFWRATHDPDRCRGALASAPLMTWRPVPDSGPDQPCALHDVVRVESGGIGLNHPFVATCPVALAFAMFERHALQPAAANAFGAHRVVRVEHLGSFACRDVRGGAPGRPSEHARANALDLSAFVLDDGRRISISGDWNRAGPAGAFLLETRRGACRYFNTVLGPDYNALHRNHFHVDMGSYRLCD